MSIKEVLKDFRAHVEDLYGKRLKAIILYGSWARKKATKDSDIDLVVVLDGNVSPGKEIDRMIEVITDLNLKYDVLLSVYPVSSFNYDNLKSPLLLNIHREGIAA